jgi:hypothetical protein
MFQLCYQKVRQRLIHCLSLQAWFLFSIRQKYWLLAYLLNAFLWHRIRFWKNGVSGIGNFYPPILSDGLVILGWNRQLLGSASIATAFMPLYQYVCNMGFSPNGLWG